MEYRLSAALVSERKVRSVAKEASAKNEAPRVTAIPAAASALGAVEGLPQMKDAVPAERPATAAAGEEEAPWPTDEAGESAFLATARENGEAVAPAATFVPVPREAAAEDDSKAALPALDSLVQRIPAEVRETLEELFRAKFTTVRRVPMKALNPVK